jgi:hypothetical protein
MAPLERSLAELNEEIDALLDNATQREFTNAAKILMQLGNRKPKLLEPRRQKLRDILQRNPQIVALYNQYAVLQAAEEKRLTYRLPVFLDLEIEEAQVPAQDAANETAASRKEVADEHNDEEKQEGAATQEKESQDTEEIEVSQLDGATDDTEELEQPQRESSTESTTAPPQDTAAVMITQIESQPAATICPSTTTNTLPATTTDHITMIPILNPSAFPVQRIQEVQAQRYPSTKVVSMWSHTNVAGEVVQVTADIQDGSVNHLILTDARLITALGLRSGAHDTILLDVSQLKIDETFRIIDSPGKRSDLNIFIVGQLVSGRNAYLYWLEHRGTADPKGPPYVQEARRIATQVGRRALDVWREIEKVWGLEQGGGGQGYRANRVKYLGEDPVVFRKDKEDGRSMWG